MSGLPKRSLRKSVKPTMPSKPKASLLLGLSTLYSEWNHNHDRSEMEKMLTILKIICGEENLTLGNAMLPYDEELTRDLINNYMPQLLAEVQNESYSQHQQLSSIDWRTLFGIPAQSPVQVLVSPASDEEDSGSGSLQEC